jgi:uncharacterized protein (DUF302 family)
MKYFLSKTFKAPSYQAAIEKVTAALNVNGFGVLTTIDMKATLKAKIGADIAPYTILGACNPKLANEALATEANIGVFLPCNVIVKQKNGSFEAVAVDPVASMASINNEELHDFANQVKGLLQDALNTL